MMMLNQYGMAWLKEQIEEFDHKRGSYIAYTVFLDRVLTLAREKYAPLAIVQTRAKTVSSFAEKAIRKLPQSERLKTFTSKRQWKKHFDPVNEFTDLCGARVITQTQEEAEKICSFIRDNFEIDEANSDDKRGELRTDQFGYLSVHYIVTTPRRPNLLDVKIDPQIRLLKAEVQVRTLLQHAWADISHDSLYKHQFKVPDKWQRDMARLAAVLEAADKEFTQFVDNLHTFAGNYRIYMSKEHIKQEFFILDTLIDCAKARKDQAQLQKLDLRKAQIHEGMAEWNDVKRVLSPYKESNDPNVLRKLGNALCRQHRNTPKSELYRKGQKYLQKCIKIDANESNIEKAINKCGDAETLADYAWSCEPHDTVIAQECYSKAYSLKPSDPYYLSSFLEFDIAIRSSFSGKCLHEPALTNAIRICRSHAEVGIELPRSLFTVGRLSLLLGDPFQSLHAYIEAVDLIASSESGISKNALDDELEFLRRIKPIKDSLEGYDWILVLLWAAKHLRSDPKRLPKELKGYSNKEAAYKGPVVIVAGSCSADEEVKLLPYGVLLSKALEGFQGEVISGGTASGASGIVRDLAKHLDEKGRQGFKTIGYLHSSVPKDAYRDSGYDLFLYSKGQSFTPLEPLQMWLDLIASGIHPDQVALIGLGGGEIAAVEYRLALALGAKVGVMGDSGRAVEGLLNDNRWKHHRGLVTLIPDPMTIRALLLYPSSAIGSDSIEKAAKASHEKSVLKKLSKIIGPETLLRENMIETILNNLDGFTNPAMQPWDKLRPDFRYSSIQQKLYAEAILRYEGYALRKNKNLKETDIIEFSDKGELNRMAEMEHGRWNLERIQEGWKRGEVKDADKKLSPYLVPWNELTEEVKQWDLDYVKRWPKDFQEAGIEIYKLEEEK
jgi:ppGpp synthetase/RelA/SpoT-type nucleotidyltranferase/chaperonin cofactor prefoldin